MSLLLSIKQLSWQVNNVQILRDISLNVNKGEVIGIIGPNGAGKTSLLNCVLRQIADYRGQIEIDGYSSKELSSNSLAKYFALVSQQHNALFDLTVFDVVHMGLLPHKSLFERDTIKDIESINSALNKVGLINAREQRFNSLSGGEQQRTLIARALVQQSKILILDEPTNHLDVYYQHQILSLVRSFGITVIMTVHDLNLAAQYCQRLVVIKDGQIKADGTVKETLHAPLLSQVFNLSCLITEHPVSHVPQVVFYPKGDTNA